MKRCCVAKGVLGWKGWGGRPCRRWIWCGVGFDTKNRNFTTRCAPARFHPLPEIPHHHPMQCRTIQSWKSHQRNKCPFGIVRHCTGWWWGISGRGLNRTGAHRVVKLQFWVSKPTPHQIPLRQGLPPHPFHPKTPLPKQHLFTAVHPGDREPPRGAAGGVELVVGTLPLGRCWRGSLWQIVVKVGGGQVAAEGGVDGSKVVRGGLG